jgi:hypothetical protein
MSNYTKSDDWRRGTRSGSGGFDVRVHHFEIEPAALGWLWNDTGPHRWAVYVKLFAGCPIFEDAIAAGRGYADDMPGHWYCSYHHVSHDSTGAPSAVEYGWDFEHDRDSQGDYGVDQIAYFQHIADRLHDHVAALIAAKSAAPQPTEEP